MTSILETEYIQQTRPYSQEELRVLRNKLYNSLRLGKMVAHHKKCDHFYCVKKNSKKEKEMIENNGMNGVSNCSVCWKIYNSPAHLRVKARNMVDTYCSTFYNEPKVITYDTLDLETIFYKWLYLEKVEKIDKTDKTDKIDK